MGTEGTDREPIRGLVLPGGGARGAYQLGVLKGLAHILPRDMNAPFPVIVGTSAGAINAAVLAGDGDNFRRGVARLERVWAGFETGMVYRADWRSVLTSAFRWFSALTLNRLGARRPRSLLDNAPLRALLDANVPFEGIDRAIRDGHLHGVGINVSGYTTASLITVCQADDARFKPWRRRRRMGVREDLHVDHLMASCGLPFIFPAVRIGREYCGDGVMRQAAPLSPAIHLGADRLLVIGVRNEEPDELPAAAASRDYPTFTQIMGYMLDTLFMDSLYTDMERLRRINQVLERLHADEHPGEVRMRRVDCDVVVPSCDLRRIAHEHADEFPKPIRLLLSGMGTIEHGSRQLLSYLLFEKGYTRALIDIGYHDALARKQELLDYLLATR